MWNEPYLETCCRSALHRLHLSAAAGRPAGLPDEPCLLRLASMGLCEQRDDARFMLTPEGIRRHATDVLATVKPAVRR